MVMITYGSRPSPDPTQSAHANGSEASLIPDQASDESAEDPVRPFRNWQAAVAALRAAEMRGDEHAEIVRLSAEVIRTRNAMTADRIDAGWNAPDDILRHLVVDDQLLREKDDAQP